MKTKTKYISLPTIVILFALVAGLAGCTKDNANGKPGPNEVWMQNTSFTPGEITVPVNTTVKWTNMDNTQHTVTSDSGAFDSGTLDVNASFTQTFTRAGQYPYHCNIHSTMTARVIVQ